MIDLPDYCEAAGASQLAQRLRRFWAERGHLVCVEIKPTHTTHGSGRMIYCVRSDLINGLPRKNGPPLRQAEVVRFQSSTLKSEERTNP